MGRDTNKQEKPRKKDEDILSVTSSHSRRCFLKDTVNMREKKKEKNLSSHNPGCLGVRRYTCLELKDGIFVNLPKVGGGNENIKKRIPPPPC